MPDPAIPAYKVWLEHRIDTTDNYHVEKFYLYNWEHSNHENQIEYPPGRSPCGKIRIQTVENLKQEFLRSFFVHFWERTFVRTWLYCKVKKVKTNARTKNQNPVWEKGGMDGGYRRGISKILPSMVAAEETGTEEPGGDGGEWIYRGVF